MPRNDVCRAPIAGILVAFAGTAQAQCPPQWLPGQGYKTTALNGSVRAMVTWDPDGPGPRPPLLVVSGSFVQPGQPTAKLAAWDGAIWHTLGSGPRLSAQALAVYNGDLIAGGFADPPVGVNHSIARWDGDSWQPLGAGTDGAVWSLTVHEGDLIAGGEFNTAGGIPSSRIARWDGQQWHSIGGGVGGTTFPFVLSLGTYSGDLIAGGFFSTAGGTPVSNIARWDGQQWHAMGAGRPGSVESMAVFGGELIAGGSMSAGTDAIAAWNGADWRPLGSGVDQTVRALAVHAGGLVAGGFFVTAGGVSASRIARWDGASWTPLGSGLVNVAFGGGYVNALAVHGGELTVGGFFDQAGGTASVNFARWTGSGVPWIAGQPVSKTVDAGSTAVLEASAAVGYTNLGYQWRRNGVAVANGPGGASPGGGTVSGASGVGIAGGVPMNLTVAGAQPSDSGVYDLVVIHNCGAVLSQTAALTIGAGCYANCDGSTVTPILNVSDFICFQSKFAAGDSGANCDGSTSQPVLNINDYVCFQTEYAAGCP